MMNCVLCDSPIRKFFQTNDKKNYHECSCCGLIFLDCNDRLSYEDEKARYESHQNSPTDISYRNFLNQLFQPLSQKINKNNIGLDFGCGPGPTISKMFQENGLKMDIYDPIFFPNDYALKSQYDFISCTEVVEHLFDPAKTLNLIDLILKKSGWLGVMTKIYDKSIIFEDWYYRKDPTHVAFYSKQTLETIADMMDWKCEIHSDNVVLFQK